MRIRCALPGAFIALFSALGNVQAQPSLTVLHNFSYPLHGTVPIAVVRDTAGNLFGATATGGTANAGVVFKVDARGGQTVLYSFTGGADGGNPSAGVILDSLGNLYGTTADGGTNGDALGVVYKVDPRGNETVLHTFTGADGANPYAGLTLDSAGNLYGTTAYGGSAGVGVVFKLDRGGRNFTVLHSFAGILDGANPYAGVTLDSAGNLYGTTTLGGLLGAGVVYELNPSGQETVLHAFTGGPGGGSPLGGVVLDADGNLYGTTVIGGLIYSGQGFGVVFELDTSGNEKVLYKFTGGVDGWEPDSGVILDSAGNLYGTTSYGGSAGLGVVYELGPRGNEKVLHSFTGGSDGNYPAGVIRDALGNLFGTTASGGAANFGLVYELAPNGSETLLYTFPPDVDGLIPLAPVTVDAAGNIYGTTDQGGTAGLGVVFKLDPSGNETILHTFTGPPDGEYPYAGVALDSAGNLYGTTTSNGFPYAPGTVYKIDTSGHETVLHTFTGGSDGGGPTGPLAIDAAGNIYGTTSGGGSTGNGIVYRFDPTGNETILHSFAGGADGENPTNGVVLDPAGNLYVAIDSGGNGGGTGFGQILKFDPAGNETVFYAFPTSGPDGFAPSSVVLDAAGNLYGTAGNVLNDCGLVFKLDPSANETVLFTFPASSPCGADGYAGLPVVVDSNGNVYGATIGGSDQDGNVYRVSPQGVFTLLYTFTGGLDGGSPYASVTLDAAGNLYGSTRKGGTGGGGVVYKITGAVP